MDRRVRACLGGLHGPFLFSENNWTQGSPTVRMFLQEQINQFPKEIRMFAMWLYLMLPLVVLVVGLTYGPDHTN